MSYFWAPSLVQLNKEIDSLFPRRDQRSDGWIGDASHQARPSDHNPDWSAPGRRNGVVRAGDWDIDDNDARRDFRRMLLNEVIGDPRVWYVISNGIIYSRTYDWAARKYTGSNPHFAHVHISIRHSEQAEYDTRPWFGAAKPPREKPLPIKLSIIRNQMLIAAGVDRGEVREAVHIKRLQRALNDKYGLDLKVDGYAGKATLNAWGMHENVADGSGRPRVPDRTSLKRLVQPRYRMVA